MFIYTCSAQLIRIKALMYGLKQMVLWSKLDCRICYHACLYHESIVQPYHLCPQYIMCSQRKLIYLRSLLIYSEETVLFSSWQFKVSFSSWTLLQRWPFTKLNKEAKSNNNFTWLKGTSLGHVYIIYNILTAYKVQMKQKRRNLQSYVFDSQTKS